MRYRAVIFDLGGVVLSSPLHAIAAWERDCGIPDGFVNRVVVDSGPSGAWSRLERGELVMEDFFGAFEADCARAGRSVDAAAMMARIAEGSGPRPEMLSAIAAIRARGLRTAALTNNWKAEDSQADRLGLDLRARFDAYVESAVVGLRKPDPRIYRLACREVDVEPGEAVFLDDIGRNLKAARELGMYTIKVDAPGPALRELEQVLGFALG